MIELPESGITPSSGTTPKVGLRPTQPHAAEGMRMDPPCRFPKKRLPAL